MEFLIKQFQYHMLEKASHWFDKNKIDHNYQEFESQHNLCLENIEAIKDWLKIN